MNVSVPSLGLETVPSSSVSPGSPPMHSAMTIIRAGGTAAPCVRPESASSSADSSRQRVCVGVIGCPMSGSRSPSSSVRQAITRIPPTGFASGDISDSSVISGLLACRPSKQAWVSSLSGPVSMLILAARLPAPGAGSDVGAVIGSGVGVAVGTGVGVGRGVAVGVGVGEPHAASAAAIAIATRISCNVFRIPCLLLCPVRGAPGVPPSCRAGVA